MSAIIADATMHRTYSLRQTRAPTASQIENPLPPPSSTKTSRLFGFNTVGHALRKNTAGSFGPDLAKKLAQLVKMEKNVMRNMEAVSKERMEVARQLSLWGEGADDDVSDISDKLGVLIYEIGELEDQFVDRYDQYRVTMKGIRNIEASVQPSRDRKAKIADQIAHLKYKEPHSPKIVVLEQELVRAEAESLVAEAQLSNITREKLKAAYSYQLDALREHCEKVALIAGYGKLLLDLVDDTPVTPGETRAAYDGYEASRAIIQDCELSLTNWVPASAVVQPTLGPRARILSTRRRDGVRTRAANGPSTATAAASIDVGASSVTGRAGAAGSGVGIDLSTQDRPLTSSRESWGCAAQHPSQREQQFDQTHQQHYLKEAYNEFGHGEHIEEEGVDDDDEIYQDGRGPLDSLLQSNRHDHFNEELQSKVVLDRGMMRLNAEQQRTISPHAMR